MVPQNKTVIDKLFQLIPDLETALQEEKHEYVLTTLRDFVYRKTNWGNDGLFMDSWYPSGIAGVCPIELIDKLEKEEISFLCAATSQLLSDIYRSFGYDSAPYNYGIPDVSTHVTTLVAIPKKNDLFDIIIQDATFNFKLSHTDGSDFGVLLKALQEKDENSIQTEKGSVGPRKIYFKKSLTDESGFQYYQEHNVIKEKLQIGVSKQSNQSFFWAYGDLDFDTSYRPRREQNILEALAKTNDNPNLFQMLKYVLNAPQFVTPEVQAHFTGFLPLLRMDFASGF